MFKLSNVSIGLKLSIMSGLGVLFMVILIAAQMMLARQAKEAETRAGNQTEIGSGIIAAKASLRGLQMAVKDVRISRSNQEVDAALRNVDERQKATRDLAEPLIGKMTRPENRARVESMLKLVDEYVAQGKKIADGKRKVFETRARLGAAAADHPEIATLDQEQLAIARTSVGVAGQAEKLMDETDAGAASARKAAQEAADHTASLSENVNTGLSVLTAIVLVISAIMGALTIARPLREMVKPLGEIAEGNFTIVVPNTDRKDEVGQIANAVQQTGRSGPRHHSGDQGLRPRSHQRLGGNLDLDHRPLPAYRGTGCEPRRDLGCDGRANLDRAPQRGERAGSQPFG